jgi:hypothetical protein
MGGAAERRPLLQWVSCSAQAEHPVFRADAVEMTDMTVVTGLPACADNDGELAGR